MSDLNTPLDLAIHKACYKHSRNYPYQFINELIDALAKANGWDLSLYEDEANAFLAKQRAEQEKERAARQERELLKSHKRMVKNYIKKHKHPPPHPDMKPGWYQVADDRWVLFLKASSGRLEKQTEASVPDDDYFVRGSLEDALKQE